VFLQETHGNLEDFIAAFPDIACKFHVCAAEGPSPATGGVATQISKEWVKDARAFYHFVFAIGRASRVEVIDNDRKMVLWNIHNFDIPEIAMTAMTQAAHHDIDAAAQDPLRIGVFLGGDFNFLSPGERSFQPAAAAGTVDEDAAVRGPRPGQRQLAPVLAKLTDIASDLPTHYYSNRNSFSRLDRVYCSLPPWFLVNLNVETATAGNPQALAHDGISDHVAVFVTISARAPTPPASRPIPNFVFNSETFRVIYHQFLLHFSLEGLAVTVRWELHKSILQEAARRARNALIRLQPRHREVELLVLNSVAHAVSTNSRSLACTLLDSSEVAQEHLLVIDSRPTLRDPAKFLACIAKPAGSRAKVAKHGYMIENIRRPDIVLRTAPSCQH
jgi:hypothetical protein